MLDDTTTAAADAGTDDDGAREHGYARLAIIPAASALLRRPTPTRLSDLI